MRYSRLLISFFLLILFGCQTMGSPRHYKPISIRAEGDYIHEASKILLPNRLAAFDRVRITQFNSEGTNIGIGYNYYLSSEVIIALTVYVYPAPSVVNLGSLPYIVEKARVDLLNKHFESVKREVIDTYTGVQVVSEKNIEVIEPHFLDVGKQATFEYVDNFSGKRQSLISFAYLFQYDEWLVKYRITYPKKYMRTAIGYVADFQKRFEWFPIGGS